jgi:hypothetical protein
MNGLDEMTTPVLQDWWEHYVCPECMSTTRESAHVCSNSWHTVEAVTFECPGSAVSPLSIPIAELERAGVAGTGELRKYGRLWVTAPSRLRRRLVASYV